MAYVLTVVPAAEPITMEEARLHLRVDLPDDDQLINALIGAARQHAEMVTQRQLITATWKLVLDGFQENPILLNKSPVQAVLSVKYLDMTGAQQILPISEYVVDTSTEPARIMPRFGKVWPIALPQIGSVEILFTAGYGDITAVPEGIKSWIKIRIGSLYENRSEIDIIPNGALVKMPFVDSLLDPFRVVVY